MTRKEAREFMMQVFFQMEATGDFDVNNREEYMNQQRIAAQKDYCNELYSLLCNKKEEIDCKLSCYSTKWKLDRMPKTDLAVVRLAACELLFLKDIPAAVSINEAVELAKKYGTEDSGKYVNAILGKVAADAETKPAAQPAENQHDESQHDETQPEAVQHTEDQNAEEQNA